MSWATKYIETLKSGKQVSFRPRGNSMSGRINSGDLCTIAPINEVDTIQVNDIVLCKVNGNQYLHLVKAIKGEQYQIGNNRGGINGWITARSIFGKCINVEK